MNLEAEEAAPSFAKRVDDQGTEKQAYRNTDCDLYHTVTNVEDDRIEIFGTCNGDLKVLVVSIVVFTNNLPNLFH